MRVLDLPDGLSHHSLCVSSCRSEILYSAQQSSHKPGMPELPLISFGGTVNKIYFSRLGDISVEIDVGSQITGALYHPNSGS